MSGSRLQPVLPMVENCQGLSEMAPSWQNELKAAVLDTWLWGPMYTGRIRWVSMSYIDSHSLRRPAQVHPECSLVGQEERGIGKLRARPDCGIQQHRQADTWIPH